MNLLLIVTTATGHFAAGRLKAPGFHYVQADCADAGFGATILLMAQPPQTVLTASPAEAEAIRQAIRNVTTLETPYGTYRATTMADAEALFQLLSDIRVSGPLYTVPKPVTREWVECWIEGHKEETRQGFGLLMLSRNTVDAPTGFVDLQVWPERASAEFGGGVSPDLQSASLGTKGAAILFNWLFAEIGIRLIAMTNALDNLRTEKLLGHLGFERLQDRICVSPDGSLRASMYWELTREDWRTVAREPETAAMISEFSSRERGER